MAVINWLLFLTGAMGVATLALLLFGVMIKKLDLDARTVSAIIDLIVLTLIIFKLWSL